MATDYTEIGFCSVCGKPVIVDEPSVGGVDEPLRHSGCVEDVDA